MQKFVLNIIGSYCDFRTQLALLSTTKDLDITITEIDDALTHLLTDKILLQPKYNGLIMLNASFNRFITNKGIRHMQLHTLNALCNPNITDKGIKHMQLHTLNASGNLKITDEGIKHMQLHTLNASYNPNITDEGIKHMRLHILNASCNPNITYKNIRRMTNCKLIK
jgi:hypothetical protein